MTKTLEREATRADCFLCGGRSKKVRYASATFSVRECLECGLAFSDLLPSQQSIRELYQDEYFEAWRLADESSLPVLRRMKHATFNRYFDRLERLMPDVRPPAKVLDVGCAAGFLLEVAKERGYEPYGIELSRLAATMAEEHAGQGRVFCGRLEDVDWPPETFDIVFLCDLLEHLPDPLSALAIVRRLTKPGGVLFAVTPDIGSPSARILGKYWNNLREEHLIYLDGKTAGPLLRRAGFELRAIEAATKVVNVKYVADQLAVYRRPVLTPLLRLIGYLPTWVQTRNFRLPSGDMTLVATRGGD